MSKILSLVLLAGTAFAALAPAGRAQNVRLDVKTDIGLSIPITVSPQDAYGNADGKTSFTRFYPARSGYTLTAPATIQDGNHLAKFHHWSLRDAPTGNDLPKPVGERVLRVFSIGTLADLAVAHYIYETLVSVRSLGVSAVPITLDKADAWGAKDGTTQFYRKFAWNTKDVRFTAPATFGGKSFYRWRISSTEQPVGQRTISLDIGLDFTTVTAYYGTYTQGGYTTFGTGCMGSIGRKLRQVPSATPDIGGKIEFLVMDAPRAATATLAVGAPIGTPFQLPGTPCLVYTDPLVMVPVTTTTFGYARVPVTIPNDRNLIGAFAYTQFFCFDPTANLLGLTTSEAVRTDVGGWRL